MFVLFCFYVVFLSVRSRFGVEPGQKPEDIFRSYTVQMMKNEFVHKVLQLLDNIVN